MLWRLRLPEFFYEMSYKEGNFSAQADSFSRLGTKGEALPVDENGEKIPCFLLQKDGHDLDLVWEDV